MRQWEEKSACFWTSGSLVSRPRNKLDLLLAAARRLQKVADILALPPSPRNLLSPSPLLALLHDFVDIRNRTYLNRAKSILKAWLLGDKLDGVIEVSRLKDLNAAKLFLGFRIGAIGGRDFAVFLVQGQRGLRRLKRHLGDKVSVGAQMIVVLKAGVDRCVSLVLGHPLKFSWLEVSQADVFH